MSGETGSTPSGWTVDTIFSHFESMLTDFDRRYEQRFTDKELRDQHRFDAQERALTAALLAQEKAVSAALLAANTAIGKSEAASEARLNSMNEFRGQLKDQQGGLMPRAEAESRINNVSEKLLDFQTTSRDSIDRVRDMHNTDVTTLRAEYQNSITALRNEALAALQSLGTVQATAAGRDKGIAAVYGVILGGGGLLIAAIVFVRDLLAR